MAMRVDRCGLAGRDNDAHGRDAICPKTKARPAFRASIDKILTRTGFDQTRSSELKIFVNQNWFDFSAREMESEGAIFTNLDLFELNDEGGGGDGGNNRRRVCSGGCGRPVSVCLCANMPPEPISTVTEIVILQHPHEQRHRLATVPVLSRCLNNCQVLIGRRLRLGLSALLDSLYADSVENPSYPRRAIFLFPGTDSMPSTEINEWKSSISDSITKGYVMIVFDGTWKHAKEMVTASLPFISTFASCVCFDYNVEVCGGSIYDSELLLRKEPFRGCMSTLEAVARALKVLEPDGAEIEGELVSVLKSMVRLQACHLKPMSPRPKLLKKKKREVEKSMDITG